MKALIVILLLLLPANAFASDWSMDLLAGTEINTGALAPDYGAAFSIDTFKTIDKYLSVGLAAQYADTITASGLPQAMITVMPDIRLTPAKNFFIDLGIGPAWNSIPVAIDPMGIGATSPWSIAEKLDFGIKMPINDRLGIVAESGMIFDSISSHTGPINQWSQGTAADFSMSFFFVMVGINFKL